MLTMPVTLTLLGLLAGCTDDNVAPIVSITSHVTADPVLEGEEVTFVGEVQDDYDRADTLEAVWVTRGDRLLCTPALADADGGTACTTVLAEGEDFVTLSFADSGGWVGSATVVLALTHSEAPRAIILTPEDGESIYSNTQLGLQGQVSDAEDAPEQLSAWWESDLDGQLPDADSAPEADGLVNGITELTPGEHTLTLWVADTSGRLGSDSVAVSVSGDNVAPSCAITAPADGTAGRDGEEVLFEASIDDPETAWDALSVTWTSDLDGELYSGPGASDGTTRLTTSALSLGTHTVSLTVADDSGMGWATCTDAVLYKVGVSPTIFLDSPSDADVVEQGAEVLFAATVGDDEDAADALALAWRSDVDGELNSDSASSAGLTEFSTGGLSLGGHAITLRATDSDGLSTEASVDLVVNGLPTAPTVSIVPSPASTVDALTAQIDSDSVDPDGDAVTYSYTWTVDGVLFAGSRSDTVAAGETHRGQTWTVEVLPSDGTSDGSPGTASVTIDNSIPELSSVTLTPDPASAGDTLSCTPSSVSDPDGDILSFATSWTVDGAGISATGTTLDDSYWSRGQSVYCTVTPSDGTATGTPVDSNTVVISNSPPSVDTVIISPAAPRTDDTLTCAYSGFLDADGDSDLSRYSWTISGTEVGASDTLSGGLSVGDMITCTVTPSDGTNDGPTVSATVSIGNTAPVLDSVSLTPTTAYEDDTFACTPGTTTDKDGDTVTIYYDWLVNGIDPGVGDSTLDDAFFRRDDSVVCIATPNDGTNDGLPVTSNTVVVSNTPPELSSVNLSPDPALEGEALACTPAPATDVDGDTLSYETSWTVSGTLISDTSASLDPTLVAQDDEVYCTVTPFDGDDTGTAVDSNTVIIANAPPSITGVRIGPASPSAGSTLTCTYTDYTDPGGDLDQSTLAWTLGGSVVGTDQNLTGVFAVGDSVDCTVTPYDGEDTGTPLSATTTIGNALPELDSVSLTPTTVYEGDTFTCTPGTSVDADGDSITYLYEWSVSGVDPLVSGDQLDSSYWARTDQVQCNITPHDGIEYGSVVHSNTVTVSNTVPEITSVTISPSSPGTDDDLVATVSTSDPDGDTVSVSFEWTVDGSTVTETGGTLAGHTWFDKHQVISVEATPEDQDDFGTSLTSSEVTAVNTPPSLPDVEVQPVAAEAGVDDLICGVAEESIDHDGDSVSYTFSWEVDGYVYPDDFSGTTGPTTTDRTDDTVPAADNFNGRDWSCSVVPSDGEEDGQTAVALAQVISYVNFGNDTPFSGTTTVSPNELRGGLIAVSGDVTVHKLALITPESSGNVKLALYTDSGGVPDALVVESESAPLSSGAVEITVDATLVIAGNYWLVAVYDQTSDTYSDAGSAVSIIAQAMTFGDVFRLNIGIYTASTEEDPNYYVVAKEGGS